MKLFSMRKTIAVLMACAAFGAHASEDEGSAPADTSSTNQAPAQKQTPNFLADCGIGGAIFKNDVGGVISNIVWDYGLTATTSGLSSPDTCEGADVAAAKFIHQTYANLSEETAIGEGQHVAALLDIYSCSPTGKSTAITAIRADFKDAINAPAYDGLSDVAKSQTYFNIVKSAVSSCNA